MSRFPDARWISVVRVYPKTAFEYRKFAVEERLDQMQAM